MILILVMMKKKQTECIPILKKKLKIYNIYNKYETWRKCRKERKRSIIQWKKRKYNLCYSFEDEEKQIEKSSKLHEYAFNLYKFVDYVNKSIINSKDEVSTLTKPSVF